MQWRMVKDAWEAGHTYALVFETGDEVIECITTFAIQYEVKTAHFTAIGAFSGATIAWFDPAKKEYKQNRVKEQVEVASLAGNITMSEGEPKVHAHVVLGKHDGSSYAGHLMEAHVRPTLELFLTQVPHHLERKMDEETNFPIIHISAEK